MLYHHHVGVCSMVTYEPLSRLRNITKINNIRL